MIIFIVLGVVVLLAFGIVGFLFYLLRKESSQPPVSGKFSEIQKSSVTPYQPKSEPLEVPTGQPFSSSVQSQDIDQMSREFAEKEAVYQKKVAELEAELKSISDKAQDQSGEALRTADLLKQENEQLKKEKENYTSIINESLMKAEETITVMRQEQGALQVRLSESQEQARKLQEEVIVVRSQMTQELLHEKTEMAKLVVENQKLQGSMETASPEVTRNLEERMNALKEELNQSRAETERLFAENTRLQNALEAAALEAAKKYQDEIDALKQENLTLKSAGDELTAAKELNGQLTVKAEALQLELTRARVQMTGFERACENYQNQLKEALENLEKHKELTKGQA